MSAPTLFAEGAVAVSTAGQPSVVLATHDVDDIIVLHMLFWGPNTSGDAANIPLPTGGAAWTQFGNQVKQPAAGNADGAEAWFWKRAISNATTNPTCSRAAGWDTGTDTIYAGRAYTIRGCRTSGDPHEDAGNGGPYTAANGNYPALTNLGLQRLAMQFGAKMDNDNALSSGVPSGWTQGTAAASATGTGCRFNTWRKDNLSGNTAADSSLGIASTHGAYAFKGILFVPADVTPPVPTVVSNSVSKISAQATKDSTVVTWSSNEDFISYMLRVVPSSSSLYTEGSLIEQDQSPSAGGTAGTQYTSTITQAELAAASPGDGTKIVKLFTRDAVGNWST